MDIVNYIILWPKAYYYSGTHCPEITFHFGILSPRKIALTDR